MEQVKDGKYLYENEWHPLKERKEKFYVRFSGWKEVSYFSTHNGVLFQEQKGMAKKVFVMMDPSLINYSKNPTRVYSIKWTMLHYDLKDYNSPFNYENLLKATTGAEYLAGAKK